MFSFARIIATCVAITASVTLTSTPAQAAQGFSLSARPHPSGGGVKASGAVTFTGQRTFKSSLNLKDLCPGDSSSATLQFTASRRNGTATFTRKLVNSNGCGTSKAFNNQSFVRNHDSASVRIVICVEDLSTGHVWGCAPSTHKNNPNV